MNVSEKVKYIVWSTWIVVFPIAMWVVYDYTNHKILGYEIDLAGFLLITVILSILPIVVNGTPILFLEGVSLVIFLYFGLFIEILFSQLAMLVLLLNMKVGKKDCYRFPINSLMFLTVSLVGGLVYYLLGGTHGELDMSSGQVLIAILGYELSKFFANHTILFYIKKSVYSLKAPYLSKDLLWEGFSKLFHFPIGLLLYILYVEIGAVSLFYVGIPLVSLSIILRSYYSSQRINDYLQKTSELGHELAGKLQYNEVIDLFIERTSDILSVDSAYILDTVGEEKLNLIRQHGTGDKPETKPFHPIFINEAISGNVWAKKKSVLYQTRKEWAHLNEYYLPESVESILSVPVIRHKRVVAVLVFASNRRRAFEKYQLSIVEILASYLGVATENARHHAEAKNKSERCALTGLYNFRYLEELLDKEFIKVHQKGEVKPLSLILLDIDHFKTVNDTYGHQSGNEILKQLSMRLINLIGDIGTVSRYGGEEFVVLLPDTDKETTHKIAETIRQMIANRPFTIRDDLNGGAKLKIRITASIGFATAPEDAEGPMDILRHADRAMYTGAKQAGRNKVAMYVK
ncbi:sensor domain-containing diguanylate cyclase [Litchfieldia alkalitelluris]|uniref:sensor domain-containing diguanylate cyclase n=1 Tax=Litchfieldia alkalitelluris TaxID=304268 RepID=UPI0009984580|nr:sensor domain-containing diguanylate cyclase [Litchfieldia alkalitelluris]